MTQPAPPRPLPPCPDAGKLAPDNHRERIFALIAHDLRNLLQPLRGYSSLLMQELRRDEVALAEVNDLAHCIHLANEAVLALLEQLLAWSHEPNQLTPAPIVLRQMVEAAIKLLAQSAAAKQITVRHSVSAEVLIYGDSNMLAAVLRNLLGNAIKFTPAGGRVCLSTERASEPGWVQVTVADTGIGLNPARPAPRTRPGTAGEHGSGLGLLLCREMVERHGGRLWLKANPAGQGASVSFTVPEFDVGTVPPPSNVPSDDQLTQLTKLT